MTQLSTHFTLEELTHTETGLPNQPVGEALDNLRRTAHAMDAVRELLGHPVIVHSGYRSMAVNQVVRGVPTSAHCQGYAVDFVCPDFGTPKEVAKKIVASDIEFDQVTAEGAAPQGNGGWCHFSSAPTMRRAALTPLFSPGHPPSYPGGIA